MNVPKEILRLIDQFEQHFDSYKSGQYNETQLRREFIDPFFKALGWDVDNTQGLAEAYKDVVHEDAIRIGGAVKAPDYCFRIGGTRKFFLEAKKPSVAIGEETLAAYQVRRYAWSAKLPLSILSDFEEFAVYDCRVKPNKTDSASTARLFICSFRDYSEKWEWIYSIFSKDSVLKGSFDKYAEANKAKRGTAEVDDDILATIEHWRSELARNLALRNVRLSQRELNFAVQRIIDRIIFLRICEDRGIELYGRLLALTNGPNIYPRLCEIFEDADSKYNSGLFYFKAEKGRNEPPDEITLELNVDDKLLHDILQGLYYPESPYEFTVISSDILGQVYEQFLGKVIRLTEGHRAVVEDKPEVKKAGGVYYTPTYIVDYIVRQTVGKLVEGKTPKQVAKLRILDPACGSGSFLINAYQFLLDWNLNWYLAHVPEGWAKGRNPVLVQTIGGWKLTIAERKRILLANIYGVDIDPQAVEVTKLSLLLKVLEGENEQTIQPFLRLFHQRALPDLGNNIKCGNSLIGPDFYQQNELPLISNDDRLRVNVFDWDAEFPAIIKSGGFDAIVGNPPYDVVSARERKSAEADIELEKSYYKTRNQLKPALGEKLNYYRLFIAQSMHLLKPFGFHGFIVPMGLIGDTYALPLRRKILDECELLSIEGFPQKDNPETRVFRYAKLPTVVYILQKKLPQKKISSILIRIHPGREIDLATPILYLSGYDIKILSPKVLSFPAKIRCTEEEVRLALKLAKNCIPLSKYAISKQGEVNVTTHKQFIKWYQARAFDIPKTLHEIYRGAYIQRYYIQNPKQGGYYFLDVKQFLDAHERKESKAFDYKYARIGYQRGAALDNWRRVIATWLPVGIFCADTINYIVNPNEISLEYILAILNSALIEWRFRLTSTTNHVNSYEIDSLPFPAIDRNNSQHDDIYKRLVFLVKQMIKLNKEITDKKLPNERTLIQRQIYSIDKEMDRLVYSIYGLTEEEIKIIEAK